MGKPPMGKFSSILQNKRNQTVKIENTPLGLFDQLNARYDIEKQINVIHDLRNKDREWFTCARQEQRAIPSLMFNVTDMNLICEMVLKSIQRGQGVWFACNMNEDVSPSLQGMAKGLYRPDEFLPGENNLEMDKISRMLWGRARCNHAMLIVGVEVDQDPIAGQPTCKSFKIENSWGAEGPGKGFYKMTVDWFHEHVYEIVVHQDILLDMQMDISNQSTPTVLPYYDFFG
jgi:aminopeptidase C